MESTSSNNSADTSFDESTNVTWEPEVSENYTEEELKKAEEFKD